VANPIACILSFAMALRYSFDRGDDADLVERACEAVLNDGIRTGDIVEAGMTPVGTRAMGDAVLAAMDRLTGG
jgi:3-isopropylmalate dehydrogenase